MTIFPALRALLRLIAVAQRPPVLGAGGLGRLDCSNTSNDPPFTGNASA
jgi:hypothetical protein